MFTVSTDVITFSLMRQLCFHVMLLRDTPLIQKMTAADRSESRLNGVNTKCGIDSNKATRVLWRCGGQCLWCGSETALFLNDLFEPEWSVPERGTLNLIESNKTSLVNVSSLFCGKCKIRGRRCCE